MCGIAGIVAAPGAQLADPADVRRMCAQIVHRGPDDEGIHFDGNACLGMRRLAIIDLPGGHQPIHNEDRSVWLVFNGEIYNYRELRRELEALGHRFYTRSDSEVIVHAYEEYGTGAFARLRGMFGIAIWDATRRRLLLARDRFGKKPLFYVRTAAGALAFGSELKTLTAIDGWRRELDGTAVREYLLSGYVPTPRAIFRDVAKLEPGSWLEFAQGRVTVQRYWTAAFGPKLGGSDEELTEQLAVRIEEAVRVRLVSDVPFGAFLSGGLDSGVVTAFMARNLTAPVRTFTIGFREARFDESAEARRVAEFLGTQHEELVVEPDAVALTERLAWHLDEPFGDSSAIPTYLVSELASRHVKMVLSGDGGDELFGGYARYRQFLQLDRLRRWSGGLAGPAARTAGGLLGGPVGRRIAAIGSRLCRPFPGSYLSGVCLTTPETAQQLLGADAAATVDGGASAAASVGPPYGSLEAAFAGEAGAALLDRVIAGDLATYLLDDILVKVDRMSMACSIEARSPLLDHELAEFALRLPCSAKLRRGTGKYLLRRVAAQLLPPDVLQRPKRGFAVPLAQWLRGPLAPMLRDVAGGARAAQRGVFCGAVVDRLIDEHLAGVADRSEPLWLVLQFELWARRFLDAPALRIGEAA
jgi:asparagine synthase (glutamine-hydrolysing)